MKDISQYVAPDEEVKSTNFIVCLLLLCALLILSGLLNIGLLL